MLLRVEQPLQRSVEAEHPAQVRDPLAGLDPGADGLATHEPAPKHQLPQVGVGVDELPPGRDLREERGQGTALQVSPAGQVDRRSVPLGQLQQPLTGDQGRGQLNEGLEIAEMRRTKLLTESFLAPAVSV